MKKIAIYAASVIGGMILAQSALALTISPPIFEIGANPGDNPTQSIKIFNETDSPLELYTSTANFTAKDGEEGTPEFLPFSDGENSLANWIQIETGPITVLQGEQKLIPYAINVPQNADPGGHYATIFFSNQPVQADGSAVALSGRLGALVLLTVAGDINESGRVEAFGLRDPKPFYDHLPVGFSLLFANSGNVHLKPQGEIKITNILGGVSDVIPFNKEEMEGSKNILPDTSRHLEAVWTRGPMQAKGSGFFDKVKNEINNFALGRYTANLNVEYGVLGKTAAAAVTFWVFPWHLILVFAIMASILIFLAIAAIRNYNNWIVKQAMKKMNSKKE